MNAWYPCGCDADDCNGCSSSFSVVLPSGIANATYTGLPCTTCGNIAGTYGLTTDNILCRYHTQFANPTTCAGANYAIDLNLYPSNPTFVQISIWSFLGGTPPTYPQTIIRTTTNVTMSPSDLTSFFSGGCVGTITLTATAEIYYGSIATGVPPFANSSHPCKWQVGDTFQIVGV